VTDSSSLSRAYYSAGTFEEYRAYTWSKLIIRDTDHLAQVSRCRSF